MFRASDQQLGLETYCQITLRDNSLEELHFLVQRLGKGRRYLGFWSEDNHTVGTTMELKIRARNSTFQLRSSTFKLKFQWRGKNPCFHHSTAQFCFPKMAKIRMPPKKLHLFLFCFHFFSGLLWNASGIQKSREHSKEHPCTYTKTWSKLNLLPYLLPITVLKQHSSKVF